MADYTNSNHQPETLSLGTAFMGFLMAVGVISGIWLLSELLQVLARIMG